LNETDSGIPSLEDVLQLINVSQIPRVRLKYNLLPESRTGLLLRVPR
jgi:hypothetical protein